MCAATTVDYQWELSLCIPEVQHRLLLSYVNVLYHSVHTLLPTVVYVGFMSTEPANPLSGYPILAIINQRLNHFVFRQ